MKIIRFCSFLLAAGLFSAVTAKADINYITNGSFEDPAEAPDSLTEITSTGVPGWTGNSIGGAAHEYIINGNITDTSGRYYGTTPFGAQYLGLNAVYRNSFHSIESQVVTGLTIGQTYTLTLYIANLDGASDPNIYVTVEFGPNGTSPIGASQTFTAPVEGPYGQGTIDFVPETLTFTPTTTSIDININNSSKQGVMGIDNVSLYAVPEPSTVATALMGIATMAVLVLRRRRQAAEVA